jgi:hypothetical protein
VQIAFTKGLHGNRQLLEAGTQDIPLDDVDIPVFKRHAVVQFDDERDRGVGDTCVCGIYRHAPQQRQTHQLPDTHPRAIRFDLDRAVMDIHE